MSNLSVDFHAKDEKIQSLGTSDSRRFQTRIEKELASLKKELDRLKSSSNERQVDWVESLRTETEFR